MRRESDDDTPVVTEHEDVPAGTSHDPSGEVGPWPHRSAAASPFT